MNSLAYTIFGGFAMALADSVPGIYKLSSLFLGFVIASLPLVVAEQRAVMGSLRRGVLPFAFGAALVMLLAALNLSSVANSSGAGVDKKGLLR